MMQTHHPGWEVRYWDDRSVLSLIKSDFAFFLPTFKSYKQVRMTPQIQRVRLAFQMQQLVSTGQLQPGWCSALLAATQHKRT
jgi:hypothetical protein